MQNSIVEKTDITAADMINDRVMQFCNILFHKNIDTSIKQLQTHVDLWLR